MAKINKQQVYLVMAVVFALLFVALITGGNTSVVASHNQNQSMNLVDIPILNYHKVDTLQHPLSISPSEFEEQMAYLSQNGYHTIIPDQLMDYLKYGSPLPEKPILLTFDDGYLDNYTNAYPIMQKYGFTATIFIVSNLVGHDARFFSWDQAREMQQNGFVFGAHTANHLSLINLTAKQVMAELTDCRTEMARQLGNPPRYFAYPTGAYTLQIEEMVRQAGYKAAFTICYGQVGQSSDLYALERIPIFRGKNTFRSFLIRLHGAPLLERLGIIK
jgi:peptidoglycan/xylan/chitin deacetylase (PgdA/CDA1 family)